MTDDRAMLEAWVSDAEVFLVESRRSRRRFAAIDATLALAEGVVALLCVFWALDEASGSGGRWWFVAGAGFNAWALASTLVVGWKGWHVMRQQELGMRHRLGLARERLGELQ